MLSLYDDDAKALITQTKISTFIENMLSTKYQ